MTISMPSRMYAEQLWEFLWRPETLQRWAGPDTRLIPKSRSRLVLADPLGSRRHGRVLGASAHPFGAAPNSKAFSLSAELEAATGTVALTIAVRPRQWEEGCRLRVTERSLPDPAARQAAANFWQDALRRLDDLLAEVAARRNAPRQALIVIHGIGEQQPGDTLAALARSGVVPPGSVTTADRWVKPDSASDSFELRQVTFKATDRP